MPVFSGSADLEPRRLIFARVDLFLEKRKQLVFLSEKMSSVRTLVFRVEANEKKNPCHVHRRGHVSNNARRRRRRHRQPVYGSYDFVSEWTRTATATANVTYVNTLTNTRDNAKTIQLQSRVRNDIRDERNVTRVGVRAR